MSESAEARLARRLRAMEEDEPDKHLPPLPPEPPRTAPPPREAAKPAGSPPPVAPKKPPLANIQAGVVRAELALLAEAEPEAFLKGLMLECRELVRGMANVICDPQLDSLHSDCFHYLQGSAQISANLAEAIAKLRQGPALEERRQRIIVERVVRAPALAAREGEREGEGDGGGVAFAENE